MKNNNNLAIEIVKELTSIIEDRVNKAIDKKFTDKTGKPLDISEFIREFALELASKSIGITAKGKLNPEFIQLIRKEIAHILAEEGLEEIDEEEENNLTNEKNTDIPEELKLTGDEEDFVDDFDDEYNDEYNDGYQTGYDVGYQAGLKNKKDLHENYSNGYDDGIREGVYRTITTINDFFKRNNLDHRITITRDYNALNIIYNAKFAGFGIPLQDKSRNPRCEEKYDKQDKNANVLSEFYDVLRKILHE